MTKPDIWAADLFCGAGGTSTGLAQACEEIGVKRVNLIAINHWTTAVETHKKNHPWATHLCTGLDEVDPKQVVPHGRLDILVASPECTHHSVARGGRPVNDQSRSTPWGILRWLETLYVESLIVENVREFTSWGPIGADGQPLKSYKGKTYDQFLEMIKSLGYKVEARVLNAADFGDATTRERLFIMARRGGRKLVWPNPSHSGNPTKDLFLEDLDPWRPAKEIIDWKIPGKSIFNRKKPLAPSTMKRIATGLRKFGGPGIDPFLEALKQMGVDVDDDLPPSSTPQKPGKKEPFLTIMRGTGTSRSVRLPVPALTAQGNHLALCEPLIVALEHRGANGKQVRSVKEPIQTISSAPQFMLCQPFLLQQQSGGAPRKVDEPVPTVAGKGAISMVNTVLKPQKPALSKKELEAIRKSLRKQGVKGKIEIHEAVLVPFYGERPGKAKKSGKKGKGQDPRAHSVQVPLPAVTSHGAGGLVQAVLVRYNGGKKGKDRVHGLGQPLPVVDTSNRYGIAQAFILPQNTTNRPRSVKEPIPTLTTTSRGVGLVKPIIVQIDHSSSKGTPRSVDKPIGTVVTKENHAVVQPVAFIITPGGPKIKGRSVKYPLPTVTCKDRMGVVNPIILPTEGIYRGNKARSVDQPIPTILASRGGGHLVQPFIVQVAHQEGTDRRVQSLDKPLKTLTCSPEFGIAQPYIVHYRGRSKVRSIDKPLPTHTTKSHLYLAVPFITAAGGPQGQGEPQSVEKPLRTVLTRNHKGLVQAFLIPLNHGKGDKRVYDPKKPMPTITSVDAWGLIEPFITKYYGTAKGAQSVKEPLDTITAKDRFGLVNPQQVGMYYLDILFRMLTPKELAAAMSFPKTYRFEGNREAQVKQIGNAVAVRTARALCYSLLNGKSR